MKAETDPITPEEWLLRIVHGQWYDPANFPFVSANTFIPRGRKARNPDTTGISLYRAACLADPADILAALSPEKRDDNGIVRIPYLCLGELGLTAVIELDDIPGHVVIPQLNSEAYAIKASKAVIDAATVALSRIASQEGNIIRRPVEKTG